MLNTNNNKKVSPIIQQHQIGTILTQKLTATIIHMVITNKILFEVEQTKFTF